MNENVENDVLATIQDELAPYLNQFHQHGVYGGIGEIEIRGKVSEKDAADTRVIRVLLHHESKKAAIPNIFMPEFMRQKGIGKKLISLIHQCLQRHGYQLFIIDLVPGFYQRLVNRGAIVIKEGETVLITDCTRLT